MKPISWKVLAVGIAIAVGVLSANSRPAVAEYPEKPVKVFVGFSAGGGTDTWARILTGFMHEEMNGMPFVVIIKPGAAGTVALKHVLNQPADGYTAFFHAIDFALSKEISANTQTDIRKNLRSVIGVGVANGALFVPMNSPYKTMKDFVDAAKANPGKLRWAFSGPGGTHHLAFSKILKKLGLDVPAVPFKGAAKARAAAVAEQVDAAFFSLPNYVGFESKVRVLGVFSDKRDPTQPDIPTVKEQGFDVSNVYTAFGMYVRAETPDDIAKTIEKAAKAVTEKPGYKKLTEKAGLTPTYLSGKEADAQLEELYQSLK